MARFLFFFGGGRKETALPYPISAVTSSPAMRPSPGSTKLTVSYLCRMDKIPVNFSYKGEEYKAILSKVSGAGGNLWHLYSLDNFYMGQVFQAPEGFRLATQTRIFEDDPTIIDYFERAIIAALG